MRITITVAAFALAIAAGPALAQGQSGEHGPPDGAGGGAGPPDFAGGGMGNGGGPPIDPPGLSSDPLAAARAIAEDRGQFGRDFAQSQRDAHQSGLTGQEQAALMRERAAQYYANAQIRRQQAQQYSQALRGGAQAPANANAQLRAELRADMEAWRETFFVQRQEWQDMRDQWLADREDLTTEEWAQRRLDWFVFRDAWASLRGYSQARLGDGG